MFDSSWWGNTSKEDICESTVCSFHLWCMLLYFNFISVRIIWDTWNFKLSLCSFHQQQLNCTFQLFKTSSYGLLSIQIAAWTIWYALQKHSRRLLRMKEQLEAGYRENYISQYLWFFFVFFLMRACVSHKQHLSIQQKRIREQIRMEIYKLFEASYIIMQ